MNPGNFGFSALAKGVNDAVPAKWENYKIIKTTTSDEVAPDGVTKILVIKLVKEILEAKLNKATTYAQSYIQKLQQKLDRLIQEKK